MENDIYPWHAEMMTSYRMSEVMRETEKIQLLQDAGLYNPGFLDRQAIGDMQDEEWNEVTRRGFTMSYSDEIADTIARYHLRRL